MNTIYSKHLAHDESDEIKINDVTKSPKFVAVISIIIFAIVVIMLAVETIRRSIACSKFKVIRLSFTIWQYWH